MLRWTMVLLVLGLGGCGLDGPSQATIEELAATPYPADAEYGPDLDIVVVRSGRSLELVNREPRAVADQMLWINRQYVAYADFIHIGTGNTMNLDNFINSYQERFPRTELFQPDRGRPVILAELYDPLTRLKTRLIVQPEE